MDAITLTRKSFQAYVDKDRSALEAILASDFHFTSPLDNCIDRDTYFQRCWPNSANIANFHFEQMSQDGEAVFVTYELTTMKGTQFRNTEIFTVRNDKITAVEVYFGWSTPHDAPLGKFIDKT